MIKLNKLYEFVWQCVYLNMNTFPRAIPSESTKYQILVRQQFACAKIASYGCPISGKLFDEAGYDIDHVLPLADGGSNDISNLQALCPSCHRVKTARENRDRDRRIAASAATSAAQTATIQSPQPVTDTIKDAGRVKNRLSDYIQTHYTKSNHGVLSVSEFIAAYNVWEAKNIKKRKKLPCDPELVRELVVKLCGAHGEFLSIAPIKA